MRRGITAVTALLCCAASLWAVYAAVSYGFQAAYLGGLPQYATEHQRAVYAQIILWALVVAFHLLGAAATRSTAISHSDRAFYKQFPDSSPPGLMPYVALFAAATVIFGTAAWQVLHHLALR